MERLKFSDHSNSLLELATLESLYSSSRLNRLLTRVAKAASILRGYQVTKSADSSPFHVHDRSHVPEPTPLRMQFAHIETQHIQWVALVPFLEGCSLLDSLLQLRCVSFFLHGHWGLGKREVNNGMQVSTHENPKASAFLSTSRPLEDAVCGI